MKRLSTILCTLALLLVGAGSASAKETTVYTVDYSTMADKAGAPFWSSVPADASISIAGGLLVIENGSDSGNNWDLQLHIADGVTTTEGLDYKVKITYKTTKASTDVTVGLGTWGDGNTVPKYGQSITVDDAFQTMTLDFNNFIRTGSNFVMWQCRKVVGTIYISKVEVIEVTADGASTSYVLGDDLVDVTPTIYVKNYDGTTDATPDEDGVITVTDAAGAGDPWATQFWIAAPYPLPAGKKFKVTFDYKAEAAGSAGTQTHGATPGSYITWHCIGDVAFTTGWKTFSNEISITDDMAGWQSIAFNLHLNSNTKYYFKNITLKEPEIVGEKIDFTVTSAGWATFSSNKDVDLGTVNGYAAKAHGSYIELIPVTEVPANNPVLIEGAGKHSFDVVASATAIAENDLRISDGSVTGDGSTIFALGKKSGVVGFAKVKNGTKIPKGKAYLVIAGGAARDFIGLDDATGIDAVKQNAKADNLYFNLAGQRVAQPTKGLYIVNGKKVIVK